MAVTEICCVEEDRCRRRGSGVSTGGSLTLCSVGSVTLRLSYSVETDLLTVMRLLCSRKEYVSLKLQINLTLKLILIVCTGKLY